MIKNIVVPLDGSSHSWCAAHHAIRFSRDHGATVHGVSVTDVKIIEGRLLDDLNVDSATAQQLYHDKGRLLLEQLERMCKEARVLFRPVLVSGVVPGTICRVATEVKAELIVMGKRGDNAQWTGPLLGSTTEAVVRLAKRPVLLTPDTYAPAEAVHVAYDGALVAVRALRFMADICKVCHWQLSVICVHRSSERRARLLREATSIADLHNVKIIPVERPGNDIATQLLDSTASRPQDLFVVGAQSRRLLGITLGNTSERIMRRAPQPVLVYRPLPS